MKALLTAALITCAIQCTQAQQPPGATSAHFTIEHHSLDAGGGDSTSAHFDAISSINYLGALSTAPSSTTVQSGFPAEIDFSPPKPITISIEFQTVGLTLQISGSPGRSYQIEVSSNLAPPVTWSNLGAATIAPASGVFEYSDSRPTSPRFYRIREL
jgi:hypothetical protein